METFIIVTLVLLAAVAAVFVGWAILSRRRSLPCPAWLARMVEMDNPLARPAAAAAVVRALDVSPGQVVADAGCGPGRLTAPLARAVGPDGRVVAVDIQQGMLDRARAKTRAAGLDNVEFIRTALGAGRLGSRRFDRIAMAAVLGEIPDRPAAMAELFGALKPGGVLAVAELIFDPHFQREATVRRLAEAAGFRPGERVGHGWAYTLKLHKPDDRGA
jgi:protein-L-isoaspartate O-methyltransferase